MKRYISLAFILFAGTLGVVLVQREHVNTRPSPEALLMAAADAQHELTRVPAHFTRMTDADEIALGNEMASRVSTHLDPVHDDLSYDAQMQTYLQTVGVRVAAHTRRRLPWTFHYIPSPAFVNAFALPGGHVFVGEGLIRLMGSEDALAAVLGHEVEHVDLRHCAERAEVEAQLRHLGALGDLAGLPMELFTAGYSKDQELEADRDGTTLAVQAAYGYTGILQLFNTFTKIETTGADNPTKSAGLITEAGQLSLATLSGYLASHPSGHQRSQTILALARERSWPLQAQTPLAIQHSPQSADAGMGRSSRSP